MENETKTLAAQLDLCTGRLFALRTAVEAALGADEKQAARIRHSAEREMANWLAAPVSEDFMAGFEAEVEDLHTLLAQVGM